jgi:hypothetical protein
VVAHRKATHHTAAKKPHRKRSVSERHKTKVHHKRSITHRAKKA